VREGTEKCHKASRFYEIMIITPPKGNATLEKGAAASASKLLFCMTR